MRLSIYLLALPLVFGQTIDEKDALAAVQRLFDAMANHDAAAMRATLLPDAQLHFIRDQGSPATSTGEAFVSQIAGAKTELLERFTGAPRVLIHGRIAEVWGEYEFLRAGKFSHCGVDSVTLFKTPDGWKISTIAYTAETTGCKNQ